MPQETYNSGDWDHGWFTSIGSPAIAKIPLYTFLVVNYYVFDKIRPSKSHWISPSGCHREFSPYNQPTSLPADSKQYIVSRLKYFYTWLSVGYRTVQETCKMVKQAASRLSSAPKTRQHLVTTFRKRENQYEGDHQSLSWLQQDTAQENHGVVVACGVNYAGSTSRVFRDPRTSPEFGWPVHAIKKEVARGKQI